MSTLGKTWKKHNWLICRQCSKQYDVPLCRAKKSNYCSNVCRAIHQAETKKTDRVKKICPECHAIFFLPLSTAKKRSHCSRFCYGKYESRFKSGENSPRWRRLTATCLQCGGNFVARGHRVERKQGKFCCLRCWGLWACAHMPKSGTSIERKMDSILRDIGVDYVWQKPLENIAVVDFYIPGKKTVVQCDGDYWHSIPRMIEKDKRQDVILKEKGYRVMRFLGSKIINDGQNVKDEIVAALR